MLILSKKKKINAFNCLKLILLLTSKSIEERKLFYENTLNFTQFQYQIYGFGKM